MTTATTARPNIQRDAVCLAVKMGQARTRKRISTGSISTDADQSLVHVSKDIYESEELKAVNQHHGEVHAYLRSRCLPSPFKSGVYLLRLTLVEEVMHKLEEFEAKDKALIDAFLAFYAGIYERRHDETSEMRTRLGSLYDPLDYPRPDRLRAAFKFDTQLWEIGTPGSIRAIDRALYEREAAKMENVWEEAKKSITQVLLAEFRNMTDRLADRLTVGADGKAKVFRNSLVGNLQEWLDVFDKRALTDDATLIAMVKRARALIAGVDPETLRDSAALATEVSEGMQEITKSLDEVIIERPGRMIDLEE